MQKFIVAILCIIAVWLAVRTIALERAIMRVEASYRVDDTYILERVKEMIIEQSRRNYENINEVLLLADTAAQFGEGMLDIIHAQK